MPTYDELPDSELKSIADDVQAIADSLKEEITFGTREQWEAWENLNRAANCIYNATWYLGV